MHTAEYDAIVVGAGLAGLYMLHCLRDRLGLNACAVEAAAGVGGTWYWNRYPGARCDIQSYHYCYAFSQELEQEWDWSERYAGQPEILRYLEYVADKFDLRRDIRFQTQVVAAEYDEAACRWSVTTASGEHLRAQFFIAASGCLTSGNVPAFEGLDSFRGRTYFTGHWPHEPVDFCGQRVGIVGTGATGIQVIPHLARQAAHLTVFQRTPNYATPLGNAPLEDAERRNIKQNYAELRRQEWAALAGVPMHDVRPSALEASAEERQRVFEQKWSEGGFNLWLGSFEDILFDRAANDTVADFVRAKIGARVRDPEIAEKLTPRGYPYGTKRQPLETGYYETFDRDNVSLVDVAAEPIERITPDGVRTGRGDYPLDSLVFATGFDAFTGALFKMGIRGRGGTTLQERWAEGPKTYLGITTHGFPNLFAVTGPLSPSVLFNMPRSIEQHCDWIAGCIAYLREHGMAAIEAQEEPQARWVEHVREVADATLLPQANSWYLGANIPGKPRVFMVYLGGGAQYKAICDEVAAKGYEGFTMTRQERHESKLDAAS